MYTKRNLVSLVLMVGVLLLPACNSQKNLLLFKPQKGSQRIVDMNTTMKMSMKMKGMPMDVMSLNSTSAITCRLAVQDVDKDGNVTVKATFESMKYEMPGLGSLLGMAGGMGGGMPGMGGLGGTPGAPDPAKAMNDTMESMSKAAKGESFTVIVSPHGEVKDIQGLEAITEKMAKAASGSGNPVAAGMKEMFGGGDSMKQSVHAWFVGAPDKQLNPGDTWNESRSMDAGGMPVSMDTTYTLKSREGGVVSLDGATKSKMDVSKSKLIPKEMAGSFKGEGSGTGKIDCSIDESSGWVTHRLDDSTSSAQMSMKMPEQLKGIQGIPDSMEMTQEIAVKIEVTNTAA